VDLVEPYSQLFLGFLLFALWCDLLVTIAFFSVGIVGVGSVLAGMVSFGAASCGLAGIVGIILAFCGGIQFILPVLRPLG